MPMPANKTDISVNFTYFTNTKLHTVGFTKQVRDVTGEIQECNKIALKQQQQITSPRLK